MISFAIESSLTKNKHLLHNQSDAKTEEMMRFMTHQRCHTAVKKNNNLTSLWGLRWTVCLFVAFRCTKEWLRTAAPRLPSASSYRSPCACPTSPAAWTQRATTLSRTRWGTARKPSGWHGWAREKPLAAPRRSEPTHRNVLDKLCTRQAAEAQSGTEEAPSLLLLVSEWGQSKRTAGILAQCEEDRWAERFVSFKCETNKGRNVFCHLRDRRNRRCHAEQKCQLYSLVWKKDCWTFSCFNAAFNLI